MTSLRLTVVLAAASAVATSYLMTRRLEAAIGGYGDQRATDAHLATIRRLGDRKRHLRAVEQT